VSIELREARPDDAAMIKQVVDAHALASFGELEMDEDEIRSWFALPNIWIQLAERDGAPVGYLDVNSEESGPLNVDARTVDAAAAAVLVEAAEAHARETAGSAVLRGFVQGDDPVLRAVYEGRGWAPIRHSFQMRIEFDGALAESEWPDGLAVRNPEPGEDERVYEAHMDAFGDHWDFRRQPYETWRSYALESHRYDPSLWWLVEDGGELAAVSLNSWHSSGDPTFGWVHVLGVRPAWRKRGLATALLRHIFRDFQQRGATRVGLGVDGENTTGAVRLYERVGMKQVRRTDIFEKML
jgi:mycothiol synthase